MSPKKRQRKNRDLPDNLYYTKRDDGSLYYIYRHPLTGRKTGFGKDRAEAIKAAGQLNQVLQRSSLVDRVIGSKMTLGQWIARYRDEILPRRRVKGKRLSPAYLAESHRILERINEALGDQPIADIRQRDIAAYLNRIKSADASNQHRVRLIQLWRHAESEEIVPENLPAKTIPRDTEARKRQRLALEQYRAIYAEARPAIRCAMELSLNALQRRTDVRKWRFDDQKEGFAHIIQSKTRKHGPSAWLRIPLALPVACSAAGAATLGDLIANCRDQVHCPFLVHEQPAKLRRAKGKDHPFQLTLRAISQGFADARDATGLFDDVPAGERPTFHELISLGQRLREEQGWTLEQIQKLRGHTTARMTEHYQEGHAWTTIEIAT